MINGDKVLSFLNSVGKFIRDYRTAIITILILCFFYWLSTLPRPEPSAKNYKETPVGKIDSIYVSVDRVHICSDTILNK